MRSPRRRRRSPSEATTRRWATAHDSPAGSPEAASESRGQLAVPARLPRRREVQEEEEPEHRRDECTDVRLPVQRHPEVDEEEDRPDVQQGHGERLYGTRPRKSGIAEPAGCEEILGSK